MNSSQKGGKTKSSSSKSKKGGNFLGSVSELFVPTGWENFAAAAGLLAIDRADAAFRRSKNSNKKQKGGGADVDGHESLENMEYLMEGIDSEGEISTPQQMNGGGRKYTKKTTTKKASNKKTTYKKKGGNFLGAVGELVAPTGWESFATAAGLLAIDRADAALRRGTKEKKEKMKGGKKMKGGEMNCEKINDKVIEYRNNKGGLQRKTEYTLCCTQNGKTKCQQKTSYGTNKLNKDSIFPSMRNRIKILFEEDE